MLHLVDLLALLDVLVVVSLTVTRLDLGSVTASVGTEVFFRLTVRDVRGLEPRNLILERVANVAGVTKTTALRVFVLKDTRFRDFFPEKGQYREGRHYLLFRLPVHNFLIMVQVLHVHLV